jgi:hypothetical protein
LPYSRWHPASIMVFNAPSYVPRFPFTPPYTIPVHEFLLQDDDRYGRHTMAAAKPPFTCGITGRSYTALEVADRVDFLARALGARLACPVNEGSELQKVISIYSFNTVWRCRHEHLVSRGTGVLCVPARHQDTGLTLALDRLLDQALEAAATVGIPLERVFLLKVPPVGLGLTELPVDIFTVDDLIREGSRLESLPLRKWRPGQGDRQTAFLCSSSGTSGLPVSLSSPFSPLSLLWAVTERWLTVD